MLHWVDMHRSEPVRKMEVIQSQKQNYLTVFYCSKSHSELM